jgi:hypothetical protein
MTDQRSSETDRHCAQAPTLEEAIRKGHEAAKAEAGPTELVRSEVASITYETGGFTGRDVFGACVRLVR